MKATIPPGQRVYAIGDIHGRIDLLETLHTAILKDAATAPERAKTVIYLGDYIDRGHGCHEVLDLLSADPFPFPGFRTVFLKGNHEDLMLGFLAGKRSASVWLPNGGDTTLRGYGIDAAGSRWSRLLGGPTEARLAEWRETLEQNLPDHHRAFLTDKVKLSHVVGGYVFVHAGIRPGLPLDMQDPEDLLWIRDDFLFSTRDYGFVVVHGHTIVPEVEIQPNRIAVDTGAWRSDRLSCLILDGTDINVIHT